MGRSDLGWLQSTFHFSFADYYNPDNMNFGVLRVINDDLIAPSTGFDTHPHKNMEIITYVVSGSLTHADSMGNAHELHRGELQYMSAGTGILHSEHNRGQEQARILQIWILPDQAGYAPNYGDYRFEWEARHNQWLHMVSGQTGDRPVKINQDVNLFSLLLDAGSVTDFSVETGRQAYLVQIEGSATINGIRLNPRDGLEIEEETIQITADQLSHFLLLEMKKE